MTNTGRISGEPAPPFEPVTAVQPACGADSHEARGSPRIVNDPAIPSTRPRETPDPLRSQILRSGCLLQPPDPALRTLEAVPPASCTSRRSDSIQLSAIGREPAATSSCSWRPPGRRAAPRRALRTSFNQVRRNCPDPAALRPIGSRLGVRPVSRPETGTRMLERRPRERTGRWRAQCRKSCRPPRLAAT